MRLPRRCSLSRSDASLETICRILAGSIPLCAGHHARNGGGPGPPGSAPSWRRKALRGSRVLASGPVPPGLTLQGNGGFAARGGSGLLRGGGRPEEHHPHLGHGHAARQRGLPAPERGGAGGPGAHSRQSRPLPPSGMARVRKRHRSPGAGHRGRNHPIVVEPLRRDLPDGPVGSLATWRRPVSACFADPGRPGGWRDSRRGWARRGLRTGRSVAAPADRECPSCRR